MNAPTTLGVFAVGLAAVFAAAVGVGSAVGPVGPATNEQHDPGTGPSSGAHPTDNQEQEHP